jgi:hypothetical protein
MKLLHLYSVPATWSDWRAQASIYAHNSTVILHTAVKLSHGQSRLSLTSWLTDWLYVVEINYHNHQLLTTYICSIFVIILKLWIIRTCIDEWKRKVATQNGHYSRVKVNRGVRRYMCMRDWLHSKSCMTHANKKRSTEHVWPKYHKPIFFDRSIPFPNSKRLQSWFEWVRARDPTQHLRIAVIYTCERKTHEKWHGNMINLE